MPVPPGHRPRPREAAEGASAATGLGAAGGGPPPPLAGHGLGGRQRARATAHAVASRLSEGCGPSALSEERPLRQGQQEDGLTVRPAPAAQARGEHARALDLGALIQKAGHLTREDVPVAGELIRRQALRLSMDHAGCFLIQSYNPY